MLSLNLPPSSRSATSAASHLASVMLAALLLAALPSQAWSICGDGVVEGGEECDPNCGTPESPLGCALNINGDPDAASCTTGTACLYRFSCCKFNCQFVGTGAPCSDDNDCTDSEECDQFGVCQGAVFSAEGSACGDPSATDCDLADGCDGAGTCDDNIAPIGAPANSQCNDGIECTSDQCNGAGGCQNPNAPQGTACGDPSGTDCDLADACNGAGNCGDNLAAQGVSCGDPTSTECDQADTCDGAGTCEDHLVAAGTTANTLCGDGQPCTFDECNGAGGCQNPNKPNGSECRGSAGACDVAEACNGGICPGDLKISAGTECRMSQDACDPAEECDGTNNACPADARLPDGTPCRAAGGVCDVAESCDDGACPADAKSTAECRASTGTCDPAEICDGSDVDCPSDVILADGASCDDGNDCTIAGTCGAGLCDPIGPAFVFNGRARFFRNGKINADFMVDDEIRGIVDLFRGTTAAVGTTVSARVVRLLRNASVHDVNATLLLGPGNVLGTLTTPFVSTGAAALCTLPAMTCSGSDVFVPAGSTQALPPGTYNLVSVGGGATLELEEGLYRMCTLRALSNATVKIVPGAGDPVLEVAEFLRVRRGFTMTSDPGAAAPRVFVGRKVTLGAASTFAGHLVAPDSVIKLGRGTVIDGTICGRKLTAYREVELGCTP